MKILTYIPDTLSVPTTVTNTPTGSANILFLSLTLSKISGPQVLGLSKCFEILSSKVSAYYYSAELISYELIVVVFNSIV